MSRIGFFFGENKPSSDSSEDMAENWKKLAELQKLQQERQKGPQATRRRPDPFKPFNRNSRDTPEKTPTDVTAGLSCAAVHDIVVSDRHENDDRVSDISKEARTPEDAAGAPSTPRPEESSKSSASYSSRFHRYVKSVGQCLGNILRGVGSTQGSPSNDTENTP